MKVRTLTFYAGRRRNEDRNGLNDDESETMLVAIDTLASVY
jgi:hypothetical protein